MLSFGTDGVRGVANTELTPEFVTALGRAAARALGDAGHGPVANRVVIGRDPRRSGPMLEAALAAGFASEGVDVVLAGVVPTPAIAHAARTGVIGAMISASHNPFPDNGVKLFAPGGIKLDDATQDHIEAGLREILDPGETAPGSPAGSDGLRPTGAAVGTIVNDDGAAGRDWVDAVVGALGGRRLDGLSIVLDCAHGAASELAPSVLRALGATVTVVNASPDGTNINADAGSTSPSALRTAVLAAGADAGLALDGDADRLVAVAGDGAIVDGDHLLAILALDRKHQGRLVHDAVVATVMSNLGFRRAMAAAGITVVETPVGDRHVLEALADSGAVLGGEQSGHVIQTDLATTGDGTLTAVTLLDVIQRSGTSLAELAADAMQSLPQVLVNVRLEHRVENLMEGLAPAIDEVSARLGENGRVLVRPSGTEPVIRIMVEAATAEQAKSEADRLAAAVRRLAGG